MAAGMGYANAFSRAGLFDRADLAALGSNSGGSWFLTQFGFDADFHRNTVDQDLAAFGDFVLRKYEHWHTVVTKRPLPNQTVLTPIANFVAGLIALLEAILEGFHPWPGTWPCEKKCQDTLQGYIDKLKTVQTVEAYDYNWLKLVRELYVPATAALPASAAARPVMTGPSLNFQITGLPMTFVRNASDDFNSSPGALADFPPVVPSWLLGEDGRPVALQGGQPVSVTPLQWVVPGTVQPGGPAVAAMQGPVGSPTNYIPSQVGVSRSLVFDSALYPEDTAEGVASLLASERTPPDFKDLQEIAFPTHRSVADVGAMSGAALGFLSSGLLLSQALHGALGSTTAVWLMNETLDQLFELVNVTVKHTGPFLRNMTLNDFVSGNVSFGLNNLAICGHPSDADGLCEYPATRYWDGGFSDDMATALTVGNLQMRYNASTPLRLILTDQNGASNGKKNLEPLFKNRDNVPVGPGEIYKTGMGLFRASPQIFADSFADLVWSTTEAVESKDGPMEWISLDTTTVDNPSFGVQAGMPVKLLMFFTASSADNLESEPAAYQDVALFCADPTVADVVKDWLAEE